MTQPRASAARTQGADLAVVPVKALAASKSRLLRERPRHDVAELSLAMMTDLIACLQQVEGLARIVVATPDREVAECARNAGAESLLRDDAGLNEAIEAACRELASADATTLVMLGDVAAAAPQEISRLLDETPARGVALAPSSDGGSSALVRRPRDVIPACFGRDSAKRHREAAAAAHVPLRELALPSLAIDVDLAADARDILREPSLGPRTRRLLEAWFRP